MKTMEFLSGLQYNPRAGETDIRRLMARLEVQFAFCNRLAKQKIDQSYAHFTNDPIADLLRRSAAVRERTRG